VDAIASPRISSVDVTVSQAIRVQGVTCEVQLLGEGTIRCVAMEATEGLKRESAIGLVDRSLYLWGVPPWAGSSNVLGQPVDGRGEVTTNPGMMSSAR
jgi:F0F1-type ATP synthase beta subunit